MSFLAVGAALFLAAPVTAGPVTWDLRATDGHVLIAQPPSDVDAVSATQALAGTWSWFFVLDDSDVAVTNPTLTVNSGFPVSDFPSLGASSFPVTVSQASLGAGETWFPNAQFGISTIPATVTPGFDSSRSVTPASVPVGGGVQTITVSVTPQTTGPNYKVSVGDLPGTTVTAVSGPSNLNQGETLGQLPGEFDLNDAVAGKTYTFTFSDQVPNPYGVPWAHKPFVFVNGGQGSAVSFSGSSTSVDFADPSLDGGTPGSGHVTFSVDQAVPSWEVDDGSYTEVQYAALDTAPQLPAPTLAVSPTTIIRGQSTFTASGTAVPGGTISLSLDGTTLEASGVPIDAGGNWSFTGSAVVGAHTLTAEEQIGAATSSPSAPVTLQVLPPAPSIEGPATVSTSSSPASFTLQGTGFYGAAQTPPAGATVTVFEGATAVGSAVVAPSGGWSMPVQLGVGSHTLIATQTLAGETSPASVPLTVTVDQVPAITSANSTSFTSGTASSFTVTTSGSPTDTIKDTAFAGCTPSSLPGPVTFTDDGDNTATIASTRSAITAGTYTLCINAFNAAGTATQTFTLTIRVTLPDIEALLLADHPTLGALIDLEAQLLVTGLDLDLHQTKDACHSLATFAQQTAHDSAGNHPALTVAQANALVADEKSLAVELGC